MAVLTLTEVVDGELRLRGEAPPEFQLLSSGKHTVLITASPELRLDGRQLMDLGGMACVRAGTEIRLNGSCFLLVQAPPTATESGPRDAICPLCRTPIAGGRAVQSPQTGQWYHHLDDLPCWTSAHPGQHPMDLSAGPDDDSDDQPALAHPWEVPR